MVDEKINNKQSMIERIYLEDHKKLNMIANNILNDLYSSEDIVHSAFISLYEYLICEPSTDMTHAKKLISIIVKRLSINLYNQRKHKSEISIHDKENIINNSVDVSRIVADRDECTQILSEAKKINPRLPCVLYMKYIRGYPTRLVAMICSISESTVRSWIFRAKKALRMIRKR